MGKADLNALLARLNPLCLERLQTAADMAASRTHYEAGLTHFVLALCESTDSDFVHILARQNIDSQGVVRDLSTSLDHKPFGHQSRPAMSLALVDVLTEAWLIASLELKENLIRSGAVLMALIKEWERAPREDFAGLAGRMSLEDLLADFPIISSMSSESRWQGVDHSAGRNSVSVAQGSGKALLRNGPEGMMAGVGKSTSALERFGVNYTERALNGEIDPVLGRDEAMGRVVEILSRRRKNNPIIVGDPGVGKTTLVEGLALRLATDPSPPEGLRSVTVWGLDLGLLDSGEGVGGDMESRLRSLVKELLDNTEQIIFFIDDAHLLLAGGPGRWGRGAGVLKSVLEQGRLRTIAAAPWSEYKRSIEKDPALSRCFQPLKLDEPDVDQTVRMLQGLAPRYGAAHGVAIRGDAVQAAAELADRYLTGRHLPDKAVDLLDTAAARVKVAMTGKPQPVEALETSMAELKQEINAMMRSKEQGADNDEDLARAWRSMDKLREEHQALEARWTREQELMQGLAGVRSGRDPGGAVAEGKLLKELAEVQGDAPLLRHEVDPDVVARVVSDWTGIPLGKVLREEVSAVLDLEVNLRRRIRGQDHALEVITRNIRAAKSGLKDPRQPLGVFLLVGPSGVGKTETALALSDLLFGDEESVVAVNMSEFQEKHSVSRLIGSPPGYVGYGEGGVLTDAVRRRPYCLVLLDEAEKAHLEVMNLFYQVFDKGVLADGEGRSVDFRNVIFFLTSNLASERIEEQCRSNKAGSVDEVVAAIRPVLSDHFKPALLARMTIVPYHTLEPWALKQVAALKLEGLATQMLENNRMALTWSDRVKEVIGERCTETETGARNIDHIMRSEVLPRMSEHILARMAEGAPPRAVHLDFDDKDGFAVVFSGNSDQE
ncbi:MAG: type VI secretion system ATPase TssH [Desulfovibrio sp.]|nr:MAG: type VI secretion system ATPase TssH [Desulfovibrio sp.]